MERKYKKIELLVEDDNDIFEELFKYMQFYTYAGHSFKVECDRDSHGEKDFFIDGEGNDKLYILSEDSISENEYKRLYRKTISRTHALKDKVAHFHRKKTESLDEVEEGV